MKQCGVWLPAISAVNPALVRSRVQAVAVSGHRKCTGLIFAIQPGYSTPSRFLKKGSANEELNSSREELQSLNEKLETANSELQGKLQCSRLADSKFPPNFFACLQFFPTICHGNDASANFLGLKFCEKLFLNPSKTSSEVSVKPIGKKYLSIRIKYKN
jgi:hypothetical protein